VSVKLRRAGGVFLVPARINGHGETLLMVDTGASDVALTQVLAERLGIQPVGPGRPVLTANGVTYTRPALLDSLHVPDESGAAAFRVRASVGDFPEFPGEIGGLLGQTFLRRFRVSIDAERGILHLEPLR
jgi:clan AA aspartic protease (TIGR02281 family)